MPGGDCRLGTKGCHPAWDSEGTASNARVRDANPPWVMGREAGAGSEGLIPIPPC